MKIVNFPTLLLLTVALSVAASGCKKTPKSPTPIFGQARTAPRSSGTPSGIEGAAALPPGSELSSRSLPSTGGTTGSAELAPRPGSLDDYFQDRDMFRQETVYFDFDRYNVNPGELPKVQNIANYLIGNAADSILVEGHCDERGTPEYNRALGERRALSVRESLLSLGIASDRIQTRSFGEEQPADPGHNESAYAKNRRADFILLKPKTGATASGVR